MAQVEAAARAGAWCLGAVAYEAAAALAADVPAQPATTALAWFCQFAAPVPQAASAQASTWATPLHWEAGQTSTAFAAALAPTHADIAAGRYYQLNLTQTYHGTSPHPIDRHALFAALQQAQPGRLQHFFGHGQERCCRFPRIIFRLAPARQGSGRILTRPMKGTATRAPPRRTDAAQASTCAAAPRSGPRT